MSIFNFVDFESLIYMKLYNLLILNKIQKCTKKKNVKALEKIKQALFLDLKMIIIYNQFHISPKKTKQRCEEIFKCTFAFVPLANNGLSYRHQMDCGSRISIAM